MKGDTMQLGLFQILILSLVMTRIRAEVEHQRDGGDTYDSITAGSRQGSFANQRDGKGNIPMYHHQDYFLFCF